MLGRWKKQLFVSLHHQNIGKIMIRIVKLLLIYFAIQLAFGGVFTVGYMLANGLTSLPSAADATLVFLSLLAQVLATITTGLYLHLSGYARLDGKTFAPCRGSVLAVSVLLIVGMGCWTNYINEALELPNHLEQTFDMMMHSPLGIIAIVVLAPFVEELLFRKAIQGYLMQVWNPAGAIIVSSLIFGLIHLNPIQIPFAFVTGLVLGWVYYRTNSLRAPVLMHFINNGSSVLLYHCTDDPNATMRDMLGQEGALIVAVAGCLVTVLCVWLLQKKLTNRILIKQ